MKVAYCGYDFFADCLQKLCEMEKIEILRVFSFETDNEYNFNDNIQAIAKQYGIPICMDKITEEDVTVLFEEEGCKCIIAAAYPYKIPIKNYVGINIHPTLLPIGRGPWPLPRMILSGQKKGGVTIHKLSKHFDEGDILIQESFPMLLREDLETLSCRTQMLAKKLVVKLMGRFDEFWENSIPQVGGEYWEFPTEEEMTFNGNMTVDEIDRIVRAYGKFDSCVDFLGESWLVWDVNCWKESHDYIPGEIVHRTNKEYLMAAKDGFVCFRFFRKDQQ